MSDELRRWFRIHLSTAVIITLTVAALLLLNMRSIWGQSANDLVSWLPDDVQNNPAYWEYGWPVRAYQFVPAGNLIDQDCFRPRFSWVPALLDGVVAMFAIGVICVSSEIRIRRGEAQNVSDERRRWFRIHLSTAVVMMFVAGGLVWANVEPHPCMCFNYRSHDWKMYALHGWPIFADRPAEHPIYPVLWASNVFVGFVIILFTCAFCEWRIRRRERT